MFISKKSNSSPNRKWNYSYFREDDPERVQNAKACPTNVFTRQRQRSRCVRRSLAASALHQPLSQCEFRFSVQNLFGVVSAKKAILAYMAMVSMVTQHITNNYLSLFRCVLEVIGDIFLENFHEGKRKYHLKQLLHVNINLKYYFRKDLNMNIDGTASYQSDDYFENTPPDIAESAKKASLELLPKNQ